MYTVGAWFPHLLNLAILAIVGIVVLGFIFYYRGRYAKEALGRVMVEIWMPSGWSNYYVVRPTMDGWVNVGAGAYKLAPQVPDKTDNPGEEKKNRIITPAKRWDMYPRRPFLGLKLLQVPIRKESFYWNNPDPITWTENRTTVTAVDAKTHTREVAAQHIAANIAETEARQRKWEEVINKLPDKMVLYILIGIAIILSLVVLVQSLLAKAA